MLRGVAIVLFGAAWVLAPSALAADEPQPPPRIYKWIDENGIAHYTTDPEHIPESLRKRIRGIRFEGREGPPPARTGEPWLEDDALAEPTPGTAEGTGPTSPGARPAAALERKIAALEAEVAREEERMKALVSEPRADATHLPDDPEFRDAAHRLPELQARLRELRARRDRADEPTR